MQVAYICCQRYSETVSVDADLHTKDGDGSSPASSALGRTACCAAL
jgi:hypothetical protein